MNKIRDFSFFRRYDTNSGIFLDGFGRIKRFLSSEQLWLRFFLAFYFGSFSEQVISMKWLMRLNERVILLPTIILTKKGHCVTAKMVFLLQIQKHRANPL